jgi:hypothetical protein
MVSVLVSFLVPAMYLNWGIRVVVSLLAFYVFNNLRPLNHEA